MTSRPSLPPAAHDLARAVTDAVAAARDQDGAAFAAATSRLSSRDPGYAHRLLGGVLRLLLEDLHPEGLAGDDLRAVAANCLRATLGWYPAIDAVVLVVVLAGALGVHPAEEEERPEADPREILGHACLLIVDLLGRTGRTLPSTLDTAFDEIARAEITEAP